MLVLVRRRRFLGGGGEHGQFSMFFLYCPYPPSRFDDGGVGTGDGGTVGGDTVIGIYRDDNISSSIR